MKIIITGGHHISALVLAKYLKDKGHQVFWFGTQFPRWPEKTEGIEYRQVKRNKIPFFNLKTGKFYANFWQWFLIPIGFFQSIYRLRKLNPQLIVSFGGYLAVPIVLAGWFLRIPSFTHEQTRTAGLANRFLQYIVKNIFITWPQSVKCFKKDKTRLVGLPVRKEIITASKLKLFKEKLPIIFVVGGKQGSHTINKTIEEILTVLLSRYNLVHQCGDILKGRDYQDLRKIKENLPLKLKNRYILKNFFNDREIGGILATADLVISRAGAHIVYELALLGKPAIFIPIPFSFGNEQQENARFFVENKAGIIIPQPELTGSVLFSKIQDILERKKNYKKEATKLSKLVKFNATEKIGKFIEKFSHEKKT